MLHRDDSTAAQNGRTEHSEEGLLHIYQQAEGRRRRGRVVAARHRVENTSACKVVDRPTKRPSNTPADLTNRHRVPHAAAQRTQEANHVVRRCATEG